jgi:hypothetical protein
MPINCISAECYIGQQNWTAAVTTLQMQTSQLSKNDTFILEFNSET